MWKRGDTDTGEGVKAGGLGGGALSRGWPEGRETEGRAAGRLEDARSVAVG